MEQGSATVGKVKNPVFNVISTGYGTALHELGHVLGLQHEHQRYDRDNYIKINTQNINPDFLYAFDLIPKTRKVYYTFLFFKWSIDVQNSQAHGSYDYNSIMHYPEWAFSNNGNDTINSLGHSIGNRTQLSSINILTLQNIYGR